MHRRATKIRSEAEPWEWEVRPFGKADIVPGVNSWQFSNEEAYGDFTAVPFPAQSALLSPTSISNARER